MKQERGQTPSCSFRRINTMLGLFVPALVTPMELLGGNHE